MISIVLILVLTFASLCSGECGLEETLCKLCQKRQPIQSDLGALEEAVKVIKNDISDLQKRKSVAFFAYLSQNWRQLTKGKTLVYDVVDLNEGEGYDKTTGKFTAPVSGLYMFYVSTGAFDRSWAAVELVVDGMVKNIGFADSGEHTDRTFATTVTPLRLKKGAIVSSRIEWTGGQYIESNQHIRTSFSAVLMK